MPFLRVFTAPWFGPLLIAIAAWLAIVAAIDPAGSYPQMPEGPGLTIDEMFNVEQGVYLLESGRHYGLGLFHPRSLREVLNERYLPDHPPLGRIWLGIHHHVTWWLAPPLEPDGPVVTACARTGSATAFALTILMIGWFAGAKYGPLTGWLAAALLPLMPRLWGHAHLASLETVTNLTCTAAVLAVTVGWNRTSPPRLGWSLIAGLLLGLALLTKIQAILLPLPIIAWTFWRWRWRSWQPLIIWGLTAVTVFFLGWPWLWLEPLGHAKEYFARATARATLSVWYLGVKHPDHDTPWHYPWVLFAATVPVATLFAGGLTVFHWRVDPTNAESSTERAGRMLLLANVVVPLIVFSLPGVAVYDCERLFLTVFPLWAILAACGATFWLKSYASGSQRRWWWIAAAVVLPWQLGSLFVYQPCFLSYYSPLVGWSVGAEKLCLETAYWGDSVTRRLLEEAVQQMPEETTLYVSPVVHQFQLDDLLRQSPILRRHQIRLLPYRGNPESGQYLLLFRRRADLPPELRFGPENAELLAETRRLSTQLAGLYRFSTIP